MSIRNRPWMPEGANTTHTLPELGTLVAHNHAVWTLTAATNRDPTVWTPNEQARHAKTGGHPAVVILTPHGHNPAQRDTHLPRLFRPTHNDDIMITPPLSVYPTEHYPVCAQCLEPRPCRELLWQRQATAERQHMDRYDTPGVCPACNRIVTTKQRQHTWPDNIIVPAGPPVTFHLRRQCYPDAEEYDRKWVAADPQHRSPTLPRLRTPTATTTELP